VNISSNKSEDGRIMLKEMQSHTAEMVKPHYYAQASSKEDADVF